MKAIVIGGGIGGTAAALSLLGRGIDVEVYEQARQLTEIGAGVQMGADASRVLIGLGLGEQLARLGVLPRRVDLIDLRTDRCFYSVPVGPEATARYGAPYYQLHRPDLLDILVSALPTQVLHLGSEPRASRRMPTGSASGSRRGTKRAGICWSVPTASTPRCGGSCWARNSRTSPASSPGAP
jgi:2-polyprenyl-6-methoxyphenol hydroxylase-like FAD-dependent oxidoreductase